MATAFLVFFALVMGALAVSWMKDRRDGVDELASIRGWLLVFLLSMTLLWPVVTVRAVVQYVQSAELVNPALLGSDAWHGAKLYAFGDVIATCGLCLYAGTQLLTSRARWGIWFAIAVLWVAGPLGMFAWIFVFDRGDLVSMVISSALVAGIWTAYLMRSKRVRARYV